MKLPFMCEVCGKFYRTPAEGNMCPDCTQEFNELLEAHEEWFGDFENADHEEEETES